MIFKTAISTVAVPSSVVHSGVAREKRGSPRAVLLNIRDYVRLAVPEPEVLRIIGMESKQKGTNHLSSRQIDQVIKAARRSKSR